MIIIKQPNNCWAAFVSIAILVINVKMTKWQKKSKRIQCVNYKISHVYWNSGLFPEGHLLGSRVQGGRLRGPKWSSGREGFPVDQAGRLGGQGVSRWVSRGSVYVRRYWLVLVRRGRYRATLDATWWSGQMKRTPLPKTVEGGMMKFCNYCVQSCRWIECARVLECAYRQLLH